MTKEASNDDVNPEGTGETDKKKDATQPAATSASDKKPIPPMAKRKLARSRGEFGENPARYTAPIPVAQKGSSPSWVPILMFGLWAFGLALIILSYMGILPGSEDNNGWYIAAGLGAILAGIITATQYR